MNILDSTWDFANRTPALQCKYCYCFNLPIHYYSYYLTCKATTVALYVTQTYTQIQFMYIHNIMHSMHSYSTSNAVGAERVKVQRVRPSQGIICTSYHPLVK